MITSLLPAWLETRTCLRLRKHGLNPVYLAQCLFLLSSLFLCVAHSCAVVDEKRSHHWCDTTVMQRHHFFCATKLTSCSVEFLIKPNTPPGTAWSRTQFIFFSIQYLHAFSLDTLYVRAVPSPNHPCLKKQKPLHKYCSELVPVHSVTEACFNELRYEECLKFFFSYMQKNAVIIIRTEGLFD